MTQDGPPAEDEPIVVSQDPGTLKLSQARAAYDTFSGKASDVARQLAFAGIAIIWIFKKDAAGGPSIDENFISATKWLVGALGADLLQYVSATLVWGGYARHKEKELFKDRRPNPGEDPEFSAPGFINWPGLTFFWLKIICVVCAYVALSFQVWGIFHVPAVSSTIGPIPSYLPTAGTAVPTSSHAQGTPSASIRVNDISGSGNMGVHIDTARRSRARRPGTARLCIARTRP